ncbi:hypothetical protein [Herbiconiux ginsengi]|uniref:Uncharacterized protein n=1 Tax=Herbiconiux ginsengi TaxID=381665 RepID=A0A1H3TG25_9MICO|nr:hypothetical protein [Herbiconiux ginsengi]SDZ48289.1 hypothetical protein SAMN05216554_4108 [Herbiconiux ginsengi]
MSDALVSSQEAADKARALVEAEVNAKVEVVRVLADAANAADAAELRAKEAAAAHESAWTAALKAGWSEKELRATGVRAPGQVGRRARPRASAATTSEG